MLICLFVCRGGWLVGQLLAGVATGALRGGMLIPPAGYRWRLVGGCFNEDDVLWVHVKCFEFRDLRFTFN